MTEKVLQDAKAREAVKTRLKENFIVEAGAGSGKTTCLIDRMAALIAHGCCNIENVAAVTFTRKAAGELKERFQVRLEELLQEEEEPAVKKRLQEALNRLERSFAGTIHSFCSRILRERPVEAGLAPDFVEIEGLEERLLEDAAWEEYLLEARFNKPKELEKIMDLDLSPEDLKEAFQKLNYYLDVEMVYSKAPYPDLAEVREKLYEFCQMTEKLLPSKQPAKDWDNLQKIIRTALRWRRMFDLNQDRYLLRLLEKMDKKAGPIYNRWQQKEDAEKAAAAFDEFRENALKPARKAWLEYRHYYLMSFLLPAVVRFRDIRRRENMLNFQDLLLKTAELLRNNSEIRGYFQKKYTHLLIDEFQDTDPIQAEIMFYLTGSDLREKDWTKLVPHPGSLFVVGDPKQSIYRFRRADIDIYYKVKDMITASGGEVLHLTSNFRSLPKLIDWSNYAFEHLFSPSTPPYQAEFVSMNEVREKEEGTSEGIFKVEIGDAYRNAQDKIAWQDALQIASWIYRALNGELTLSRTPEEKEGNFTEQPVPDDFLILVYYKKHMSVYARALEKLGVPFVLTGSGDISDSRELKELSSLLKALADPEDPVSLTAVLRGLFFGISDDHLYRFQKADGKFSFLSDIPANADEDVSSAFAGPWETLRRYWSWTRELPPSSALEKIISELGLLPLSLAGEMGRGQAGSLLQALELLRQKEWEGETGFPQAVDFLLRLLEEGTEEELDVEGGNASAVNVMNLHKAKGLEASVVILANPGGSIVHEPDMHVVRRENKSWGYLVLKKNKGKYNYETLGIPPFWETFQQEEQRYLEAEKTRLLYVAATRAKDLLVVSTYPKKPENSPWQPLEHFLTGTDLFYCEELSSIESEIPEEPERITSQMLEDAKKNLTAAVEGMSAPSYRRLRSTEVLKGRDAPERSVEGYGRSWGNVIHGALEYLANSVAAGKTESLCVDNLRSVVEGLLQREGLPLEQREEVLGTLKEITDSPFWQRVCASSEIHTEVSFGIMKNDTYTSGVIDLAFREKEGWVLVDYKTDLVESDSHLQELLDYYYPQVELYLDSWEEISGEKVVEAGFFFTHRLLLARLFGT